MQTQPDEATQRLADILFPYLDAYEAEREIAGADAFNAVVDARGLSLFVAATMLGHPVPKPLPQYAPGDMRRMYELGN